MHADEFTPLRNYISQFLDVSNEEWRVHREGLSRRSLKKGEVLLAEGEVHEYVSFVNKGALRMYRQLNGEEITVHFTFENDYISEYVSFLTRTPSIHYIKALEDSELIEMHYDKVQELYERFPVWQKYGRLIAERLFIQLCERNEDLHYQTPEENYLQLIEHRPYIIERVSQLHIASYLGIQPESLSRIRKRMMEVRRV
jgi:CRP/FNR family transcriptional regulator, anaerobic regulatory protein